MSVDFSDLPDWRDPKAYPREGEYSASQWAWEFLRRREDYRKAWQGVYLAMIDRANSLPVFTDCFENAATYGGVAAALDAAIADVAGLKERLKDDNHLAQWDEVTKLCQKSRMSAHEFFLPTMLDPRLRFDRPVPFRLEVVLSQTGTERKAESNFHRWLMEIAPGYDRLTDTRSFSTENPWTHEPFQLHLTVDMRVPIGTVKKRLLEEVERRYKEAESSDFMRVVKRNRDDKYPLYLRALDATRAGASLDEIGECLFAGQHADDISAMRKQVKKTIESASDEQRDFWKLAHLES